MSLHTHGVIQGSRAINRGTQSLKTFGTVTSLMKGVDTDPPKQTAFNSTWLR